MTLFALLLVGTSAFTHATWNLLCKSRTPSGAFFLVSTTASVTALLPFLLGFGYLLGTVPARFWLLLALTGAVQAVYYNMLGNAYRLTEISVAYPLARSIPILFTPMITGLFGLGAPLSFSALGGMALVFIGCLVLPQPNFRALARFGGLRGAGFLFILGAAFSTAVYSVIDSEAMGILRTAAPDAGSFRPALLYIALENIAIEIFLLPYILYNRTERANLKQLLRTAPAYPLLSGLICSAGYTLVLAAMTQASNVSYVVAFRQLSIPIGALLGIWLLHEKKTTPKWVGLTLLLTGLVIVALH